MPAAGTVQDDARVCIEAGRICRRELVPAPHRLSSCVSDSDPASTERPLLRLSIRAWTRIRIIIGVSDDDIAPESTAQLCGGSKNGRLLHDMDSESQYQSGPGRSYTRSFISRTFTRRVTEQADEPTSGFKGPLGLTTVFDPGSDAPCVADIIFVHGLNGGSYSTWSKGNQQTHFWPQEWLPLDDAFQDVRIHMFGYPSGLSRESVLNVHDFARSLLAAVKDLPVINQGHKVHNSNLIYHAQH